MRKIFYKLGKNALGQVWDMDIIIPLGKESHNDNIELRMLLRSIEKNGKNLGTIYIATVYPPKWLDQTKVVVVPIKDEFTSNKDANLHKKILGVIEKYNIGRFVFSADDNAFLRKIDLNSLPITHNKRGIQQLRTSNKWESRVINTIKFGEKRGIVLNCNFESHCPMEFDGQKVLEGMKGVDYESQPGLTICTCWKIVSNDCANIGVEQSQVKITMESAESAKRNNLTNGKLFLGYNDNALQNGLKQKLLALFPDKSQYEL